MKSDNLFLRACFYTEIFWRRRPTFIMGVRVVVVSWIFRWWCGPFVIVLGMTVGCDKAFPAQHIAGFKSLLKMNIADDLTEVQDFLYGYLEGANQFVESRCSIFGQSITKGYCVDAIQQTAWRILIERSSRSKSKFRHLCPKSVSRYRKPLFHLISILLWFNFQCRSRKKFVNCVDLGLTPDIKRSVSKFYGWSIQARGPGSLSYCDGLSKHANRLLTASLTGQGPSDRKIHGPFDYVLILAMYLGDRNFHEADCIGRHCAVTQGNCCLRRLCPTTRNRCSWHG